MFKKILFFIILCFGLSFYAQADLPKKNRTAIKKLKKQRSGLVSEKVYRFIERAYDLASRKKYQEAIKVLNAQVNSPYIKPGEKAQVLRSMGFIYAQKEDFPNSIKFLRQSMGTKKLSYKLHLSTLYAIAQITISTGDYVNGQKILEQWFSLSENPRPDAYVLYAVCLLQKKQENKALKYVEKTIAKVNRPKESWLRFALSLNIKKGNYKRSKDLLEKLVAQFPTRPLYWRYLAGVYIHLNDNKKALVTLNLANKMGYLEKESDYFNLAQLLMDQGLPYQAAKTLKKSINQKKVKGTEKNMTIMADAYLQAREADISLPLFAQLLKTSNNKNIHTKYGFLLLQKERWPEAEKVFSKALTLEAPKVSKIKQPTSYPKQRASHNVQPASYSKQGTSHKMPTSIQQTSYEMQPTSDEKQINIAGKEYEKKDDKVYLGLGIALFYQKKYEQALKHFQTSFKIDSDQSAAFNWIQYAETIIQDQKQAQKKTEQSSSL